jgi:hypothetical protein
MARAIGLRRLVTEIPHEWPAFRAVGDRSNLPPLHSFGFDQESRSARMASVACARNDGIHARVPWRRLSQALAPRTGRGGRRLCLSRRDSTYMLYVLSKS